jgi:hypothetical protein
MSRIRVLACILALSLILSTTGVIYCSTTTEVINYFETGVVNVELQEYQIVDGKETAWVDNPLLLPGDTVSKIPRVFIKGTDCYVRVRLTIRGIEDVTEDNLFGINENLIKADDGYWYFKDELSFGDSFDIFQGVYIPTDFSQEWENEMFYIDIDVDAIQSKNFAPDYSLSQPWGSVEVLKYDKTEDYDLNKFKASDGKSFKIVYEGDSGKLIKNEDDFFANFPYMMPGDTYSDYAVLKNDSDTDITMYFRTADVDDSELLDKLQLKITTVIDGKAKTVYEGNLRASKLNENTVLGVIPAGVSGEFYFDVTVPAELNNKYTISSSKVKWVFSTEPIEMDEPPKTGDDAVYLLHFCLLGAVVSCCGLIFLVVYKRRLQQ